MALDHRHDHLKFVRSVFGTMVYPLQFISSLSVDLVDSITAYMITRNSLIRENRNLKEEHLLLNAKLQRFTILEEENKRLKELLESSFQINDRVLLAELLAVNMQPFRQQIVINKGEKQGAYNGQPIVDASGIMGQIVDVGPFSSTVLLVTDLSHALPVQIDRNGLRAIATGMGDKEYLHLDHLPTNADVRQGDLVISSGLGQRFPRGYPVGVVTKITLEPGESFAKIVVKASAQLGQSREVLMIWPNEHTSRVHQLEDYALQ